MELDSYLSTSDGRVPWAYAYQLFSHAYLLYTRFHTTAPQYIAGHWGEIAALKGLKGLPF